MSCIERIRLYTGFSRETFFGSPMVQDAVIRNLQTLAESTQRLTDRAKGAESSVPWRSIAGFRNVLTHNYLEVDLEVVWSVVEKDIPAWGPQPKDCIGPPTRKLLERFSDGGEQTGNSVYGLRGASAGVRT